MAEHIEVTLDFIPVSERWPLDDVSVLALSELSGSGDRSIYHAWRHAGVWENPGGGLEGESCRGGKYRITHWSAIPNCQPTVG